MSRNRLKLRLFAPKHDAPIFVPPSGVPALESPPVLSGIALTGQTIVGTNGGWSNNPTHFTYQAQSSADGATGWVDIPGSTAASIVLGDALADLYVRLGVRAHNAAGPAVQFEFSAAFGPIVSAAPEGVADYIATSAAQLVTHVNTAIAAGGNKIIELADSGSFGSTIIDLKNKNPATRIFIRSETIHGVETPGFDLEGSSRITVRNIRAKRLRNVVGTAGDVTAGVFRVHASSDITFEGCDICADPMTGVDLHGYMSVSGGSGTFIDGENVVTSAGGTGRYKATAPRSSSTIFAITGPSTLGNDFGGVFSSAWLGKTLTGVTSGATRTIGPIVSNINFLVGIATGTSPCARLKVTGNKIHDVKWGVAVNGTDVEVIGNEIVDFYISPFDYNGDMSGLRHKANRCYGGWAVDSDGEPSGTNGPHSSVGGFSFGDKMPDDIEIEGNIHLIGRRRQDVTGEQAFGTGNKVNDMECTAVGSISGTTMTITGAPSLSFTLKVGMRVVSAGVAPDTVIAQILTGTGKIGTYRLSKASTVASSTLLIQSRVTNFKYRNNLVDCNASIGTQLGYMGAGCEIAYNTVISTRDTRDALNPATPSLYFNDDDAGMRAHHNVVMALAVGAFSRAIHADVFRDSIDNVVASRTATTGPQSFEELFDGVGGLTPFSGANLDNILRMFAPKAGGRIESGYGHAAYYDWDTHEASYPTVTPPYTTEPTGLVLPRVNFDGVNDYARYTVSGSENILDFTTGEQITIVMGVRMLSPNASDIYLLRTNNNDIQIRRLPSGSGNRLRISLKGTAGQTSVSIDTTCSLSLADTGVVLLAVSIDLPNYRFHVMKGALPDSLANPATWTGESMRLTADVMGFMATDTGSGKVSGDVTFCYVHEGFWDGLDQDAHDALVARDGNPVDYGADGSSLLGVQPKLFAKGDAAAWTGGGAGINLGSAPRKLIVTGALIDA